MAKKRAIISYDNLSVEQKKQIFRDFPDGYGNLLTEIKTPKGETLEALIWETEEVIYLVKITKMMTKALNIDDDDDDDDFDDEDLIKPAGLKDDEIGEEEDDEEEEELKRKKVSAEQDEEEE
jgi:DNA-directed RNA polymerase subunit delta